jgi:MFS family permease
MTSKSRNPVGIVCAGLFAFATALGIGRFGYTPILPFMMHDLGLTTAQGGLIGSASLLGYLVGAIVTSKASLPGGMRLWTLAGVAGSVITTACLGLGTSMVWFLTIRFISGVCSTIVLVFGTALILDALASRGRLDLAGLHFSGLGVGISVSAIVVSGCAALGFDWAELWLASGVVSLAGFALVIWLAPESPVIPPRKPSSAKSSREPGIALYITAYGLVGFGYVITATFISAMTRLSPGLRPLEPYIWLLVGLAAIPSVNMWTWIGRKIGYEASFATACVLLAAGVALSVLGTSETAVVIAALVVGGTFNGIGAVGLIGARALTKSDPRRIMGIMTMWFGLGQVIGPVFAGYVSDSTGSFVLPSLVAALTMLAAAGLAMISRRQSRVARQGIVNTGI